MKLALHWVDAFTDRVFSGNPAGVVPLAAWSADSLMQQIAFENGFAETAFFVRTGPARYNLRWFTPTVEVDLCGHATLASAFVLFQSGGESADVITFDSRSGPLVVTRRSDGKIEMDFPALATEEVSGNQLHTQVAEAIGTAVAWLGRTPFDLLALVPDQASVQKLRPDLTRVSALGGRGVIVTAAGETGADFVSRFFAPQAGVPEDPVTGSAHCALAPFWAARLGKTALQARQLSPRGGGIECRVLGDRVRLAGGAVRYLVGEIEV